MDRLARVVPFIWSALVIVALALVSAYALFDTASAVAAWTACVLLVAALLVAVMLALGRRVRRR